MKNENASEFFPHPNQCEEYLNVGRVCLEGLLGIMVSAGQTDETVLDVHSLCLVAPGMFFLNPDPLGEAQHCTVDCAPSLICQSAVPLMLTPGTEGGALNEE